ncbi:hypothetical protein H1C71_011813, partial [Ictidomys tridecemlineatus]
MDPSGPSSPQRHKFILLFHTEENLRVAPARNLPHEPGPTPQGPFAHLLQPSCSTQGKGPLRKHVSCLRTAKTNHTGGKGPTGKGFWQEGGQAMSRVLESGSWH